MRRFFVALGKFEIKLHRDLGKFGNVLYDDLFESLPGVGIVRITGVFNSPVHK